MSAPFSALSTPEARGFILCCMAAEDPAERVQAVLAENEDPSPEILKVAQFALMAPPVIAGVRRYVEDPFKPTHLDKDHPLRDFHDGVAKKSSDLVEDAINDDPNKELVEEINRKRVEALKKLNIRTGSIAGYTEVILPAAKSAANSTTTAATLVATELARAEGTITDRAKFINDVKKSGSLERSLSRLSLAQLNQTAWAINVLANEIERGDKSVSPNRDNISTTAANTVITNSLQEWQIPGAYGPIEPGKPALRGSFYIPNNENERDFDVRIGCLITFDPKLVTDYYKQHVDGLEQYNLWPEHLQRV